MDNQSWLDGGGEQEVEKGAQPAPKRRARQLTEEDLPVNDYVSVGKCMLGCPVCTPRVPTDTLATLMLALPGRRRMGWSSTPCGTSEAIAAPSAAAPTATAGGCASPSWATTPTPTATRAGG